MNEYRRVVWQLQTRDLQLLEGLSFDRSFAPRVGLHMLRKFLVDKTWRAFQADVPIILRTLRSRRSTVATKISEIRSRIDELNPARLRAVANSYVVELLQVIDVLVTGSSEGNPNVNGQTLEEEKVQALLLLSQVVIFLLFRLDLVLANGRVLITLRSQRFRTLSRTTMLVFMVVSSLNVSCPRLDKLLPVAT